MATAPPALAETTEDGRLRLNFHPGQWHAWESERRFVVVLAGTQGGKTSFGPYWLWREIQRRGAGDYIVVTPTYPLLIKKALPEFRRLFEQQMRLGEMKLQEKTFVFSEDGQRRTHGQATPDTPTKVFFGHATDPESLESATAKGAWLDEAGQKKFKLESWEAIMRRLSIHEGRVLVTTTPYDLGWLKQKMWDRWNAGDKTIDVVRFDSTENPVFPQTEFERARGELPRWKFDLFYRAIFTRPAGLIYDSFNEEKHKVKRFAIPKNWPRYLGLDFGGVNTAGMFYAEELDGEGKKTGRLFAYREYKAGGRTAAEHCYHLLKGEPGIPTCVGGSKSEDQWRREFAAGAKDAQIPGFSEPMDIAGIPVREPVVSEVEVGIDRVYGAHKRDEILVFDDLNGYLEQKMTYSRELDERGEPTEKIADKETFHFLDAERYIISFLRGKKREFGWW